MVMGPAQQYWFLAPLFSFLALACVLWLNWGRPRLREWRMKAPFDAFLTLYPEAGRETWTRELHVPPSTKVELQVRMETKLHHTQYELIFGFEGNKGDKPDVTGVVNHFIVQGQNREQAPGTTPSNYIDYRGHYHIKERNERTKPNCYASGFKIVTRKPGRYPVHLRVITDCGDGGPSTPLVLVVEDRPSVSSSVKTPPPSV